MEQISFDPQGIAEQRAVCKKVLSLNDEVVMCTRDFLRARATGELAALDEIERLQGDNAALRAQVASLTRERDAALANGEKAKQYWMQANEERDAAINDLTTAMVDMYIDGRGDETHICWACAYAKRDKNRYPCSSCINYEMAEFVHRGPCADNAPEGAGEGV